MNTDNVQPAITVQMMWDSAWAVRVRIPAIARGAPHELVLREYKAAQFTRERVTLRFEGAEWVWCDLLVAELKDAGSLRYVAWVALLSERDGQAVLEGGQPPKTVEISCRTLESEGMNFPDEQAAWNGSELALGDFAARVDGESVRFQFVLVRR